MNDSSASLSARWFNGQQARAIDVLLEVQADELLLRPASGGERRYPRNRVTWPERTRHGARQLILPDGGVVEVADATAWDEWAAQQRLREPLAVRWALSWRATLGALVALVAVMVSAALWGIPWAADHSAALVPQAARKQLDRSVMSQLTARDWLKQSELPEGTAERLRTALDEMLDAAYPAEQRPKIKLDVYRMPTWAGPNAFALPGGQVVVSDALLKLLPEEDGRFHPGVLGVLAHEVGHVHEEHSLRILLSSSATGLLLGWWIGDFSTLLAGAPALLMQASYSRQFERAADDEALRIMRAAGIDPRGMVAFFAALQRAAPERDGDSAAFGLSSHPPDSERMRLFETGKR